MNKSIIVICYADAIEEEGFSIVRVPWEEKLTLRRKGVLSIAVLFPGDPNRECRSIYHDYYQLIWTDTAVCLTGHDGDLAFYSFEPTSKGEVQKEWRFPFILPENCIEFEGETIDSRKFKKSMDLYGDRKGVMY